ncbi:uncharacterized protein [Epargyreus clarus]|uniref:uncharacterized protein n=1 Tax=Epargyreus clarus TaxID=520877 RepID=UPI003C2D2F56
MEYYDELVSNFDLNQLLGENEENVQVPVPVPMPVPVPVPVPEPEPEERAKNTTLWLKSKIISSDMLIQNYHTKSEAYVQAVKAHTATKEDLKHACINYKEAMDKCDALENEKKILVANQEALQNRAEGAENKYLALISHTNQLKSLVKQLETEKEALLLEKHMEKNNDKKVALLQKEKETLQNDITTLKEALRRKNKKAKRPEKGLKKYGKQKTDMSITCMSDESDIEKHSVREINKYAAKNSVSNSDHTFIDIDSDSSNGPASVDTGRGSSRANSEKCLFSPDYFIPETLLKTPCKNIEVQKVDGATSPIIFSQSVSVGTSPNRSDYPGSLFEDLYGHQANECFDGPDYIIDDVPICGENVTIDDSLVDACTSPIPTSPDNRKYVDTGTSPINSGIDPENIEKRSLDQLEINEPNKRSIFDIPSPKEGLGKQNSLVDVGINTDPKTPDLRKFVDKETNTDIHNRDINQDAHNVKGTNVRKSLFSNKDKIDDFDPELTNGNEAATRNVFVDKETNTDIYNRDINQDAHYIKETNVRKSLFSNKDKIDDFSPEIIDIKEAATRNVYVEKETNTDIHNGDINQDEHNKKGTNVRKSLFSNKDEIDDFNPEITNIKEAETRNVYVDKETNTDIHNGDINQDEHNKKGTNVRKSLFSNKDKIDDFNPEITNIKEAATRNVLVDKKTNTDIHNGDINKDAHIKKGTNVRKSLFSNKDKIDEFNPQLTNRNETATRNVCEKSTCTQLELVDSCTSPVPEHQLIDKGTSPIQNIDDAITQAVCEESNQESREKNEVQISQELEHSKSRETSTHKTQELISQEKICLENHNSNNLRYSNTNDAEVQNILNVMKLLPNSMSPIPKTPIKIQEPQSKTIENLLGDYEWSALKFNQLVNYMEDFRGLLTRNVAELRNKCSTNVSQDDFGDVSLNTVPMIVIDDDVVEISEPGTSKEQRISQKEKVRSNRESNEVVETNVTDRCHSANIRKNTKIHTSRKTVDIVVSSKREIEKDGRNLKPQKMTRNIELNDVDDNIINKANTNELEIIDITEDHIDMDCYEVPIVKKINAPKPRKISKLEKLRHQLIPTSKIKSISPPAKHAPKSCKIISKDVNSRSLDHKIAYQKAVKVMAELRSTQKLQDKNKVKPTANRISQGKTSAQLESNLNEIYNSPRRELFPSNISTSSSTTSKIDAILESQSNNVVLSPRRELFATNSSKSSCTTSKIDATVERRDLFATNLSKSSCTTSKIDATVERRDLFATNLSKSSCTTSKIDATLESQWNKIDLIPISELFDTNLSTTSCARRQIEKEGPIVTNTTEKVVLEKTSSEKETSPIRKGRKRVADIEVDRLQGRKRVVRSSDISQSTDNQPKLPNIGTEKINKSLHDNEDANCKFDESVEKLKNMTQTEMVVEDALGGSVDVRDSEIGTNNSTTVTQNNLIEPGKSGQSLETAVTVKEKPAIEINKVLNASSTAQNISSLNEAVDNSNISRLVEEQNSKKTGDESSIQSMRENQSSGDGSVKVLHRNEPNIKETDAKLLEHKLRLGIIGLKQPVVEVIPLEKDVITNCKNNAINYKDLDMFTEQPNTGEKASNKACNKPTNSSQNLRENILCSAMEKYGVITVKRAAKKIPENITHSICQKIEDSIADIIKSQKDVQKKKMDDLINGIRNLGTKSILSGLMMYLKDTGRKCELFTKVKNGLAPPMTKSEVILLYVIEQLNASLPSGRFIHRLWNNIEHALFQLNRSPHFDVIESMSHFYAVMCRYFRNKSRLRCFMLDAMYCLQYKAVPLIRQCLDVCPGVLPNAYEQMAKTSLVTCLVYLLHFYKCEDKFNRARDIRTILYRKYSYRFSEWNETMILEIFRKAIMDLRGTHNDKKMLRLALIILCKRHGAKWCQRNIITNMLLPIIEKQDVPERIKLFCVLMLGPLLKPFPADRKVHCEIVINQLLQMLQQPLSQDMKEAIYSSLMFMHKHDPDRVVQALLQWNPKDVSKDFEEILNDYIMEKPLSLWKNLITKPSVCT